MEAKSGGFSAHDEMFTGEPDAGNLQVRFDEGEWQARRKAPATLYSTGKTSKSFRFRFCLVGGMVSLAPSLE